MQPTVILRISGLLLMLFSLTMLPPIFISWLYEENSAQPFILSFAAILLTGLFVWMPVRQHKRDLRLRDGFLIVVSFWIVLGTSGSIPLLLNEQLDIDIIDALFESLSGLTTTGATVITGIDQLPKSILYYRQQLQWLGGMGIIVLAVAILPMLGVGGMQLYRAETPGPVKDNKLTPRITETAKSLWYIYMALTILCAVAYYLAGMSGFDALAHSFSTIAIGGFSTHDMSMGYFDNALIEGVAIIFMFIAGVNFSLHFFAWNKKSIYHYWRDSEFQAYLIFLSITAVITTLYLIYSNTFDSYAGALHHGLFQAVSIGTTTGFTTANYSSWPGFLPVLLLFASFIGACAGSTGGGMKVIRFILLIKQGIREVTKLIHPNAQIPIKIGGKALPYHVTGAIWGFFSLYVASFTIMLLMLLATGLDQVTAFSALAACMNNLGPALGDAALHYGDLNDSAKLILTFAMLIGRLEIFSLLVLFSPAFWRY